MKKSLPKNTHLIVLLIIVIAMTFFLFSSQIFQSSLNSLTSLSGELSSSPDAIYKYKLTEIPPFKYRILFSSLVLNTYKTFSEPQNNENFYIIYTLWSGLSYIGAALSFFFLLKTVNFGNLYSLGGVILYLFSPAVLFGYSLPVHSREDFLAYTILNICLIFIIKNNIKGAFLFSILGILCRETLLIVPFLYLFFGRTKFSYRLLTAGACFLTFILLRYFLGYQSYNALGLGLFYNLQNIEESAGFIFLVFGFMWPIFFYDSIYFLKKGKILPEEPLTFIRKTSIVAFLLIFSTTFLGGRINEIRLLFLLFPWVITIFLYYFMNFKESILNLIRNRTYRIYVVICACAIIPFYYVAALNIDSFTDGKYAVPYNQWIIITCIYLLIFCSSIPIYLKIFKSFSSNDFHPLIKS